MNEIDDFEQPMPVVNEASRDVFARLIGDLQARNAKGVEAYGKTLTTFNGRDSVRDAREEALDLAVYLTQVEMEMAAKDEAIRGLLKATKGMHEGCDESCPAVDAMAKGRAALGGRPLR